MSHVPEEHLDEYRRRRGFAQRADTLGNTVSGLANPRAHGLANQLWSLSEDLKEYANELRA